MSPGGAFAVSDASLRADDDATTLARLRALVYSRAAASSPDIELHRSQLAELEQRMTRNAERQAAEWRAEREAAAVADEAEIEAGSIEAGGAAAHEPAAGPHHRHPVLATVGLILITATVVGGAVTRFVADVGDTGALSIFARPADSDDALTGSLRFTSLGGSEVAESRRLAGSYGWDIWAVRTDDASVCLYAERAGTSASMCASAADFDIDGVAITLPNSYAESSAYSTPSVGQPVTLSWGPEDTALTFVPAD